ncbi:MAG: PHP domain-containing protein [Hyphomonadaceae bacterium]|nr:PHP domain-containing protein [Clostridia bacterium]
MNGCVDLHTHSMYSDGTLTPTQLVQHAVAIGLRAIALTDHDTVEGLAQAQAEAEKHDITFVTGIEIGVAFETEMHILGLNIDYLKPDFLQQVQHLRSFRNARNPQIIDKLNALGIDITMDEVSDNAGGQVSGRLHIANVLVQKGAVASTQEAFSKYLGETGLAYVRKQKLTAKEGIAIIKQAGGLAFLAHPIYIEKHGIDLKPVLVELKAYGLGGIEAYYSEYSAEDTVRYLNLCEQLGLLPCGGSDFHGANKPEIALGNGRGTLCVPDSVLKKMLEYR